MTKEEISIIERTCKRDAYQWTLLWSQDEHIDKETIIWWLKEKIDSHSEFLKEQDVDYEYSTQTLVKREDND